MRIALVISGSSGCGGVPALVSALRGRGWEVVPVLLPGASEWLGPALMADLCGQGVADPDTAPVVADVTVAAPCDDALSARFRRGLPVAGLGVVRPPLVTVPARAEAGGVGLTEPEAVCETVAAAVAPRTLAGKAVLVSAGPTCEDLDPVRFLSNRSTGRMGLALALAAWHHGARVTLVHGPLRLAVPALPGLTPVPVYRAAEMCAAVMDHLPGQHVAILCAAVADFAPAARAPTKIKKGSQERLVLELIRTPDILATVGALPQRPFLVGFAAETHDLAGHAVEKLRRKNCDLLCANDVTEPGSGFAVATNRITMFSRDGTVTALPQLSKTAAAERIIGKIAASLGAQAPP